MDIVKLLLYLTLITLLGDIVHSTYPQCAKDETKTVYIKNFVGSGILKKNF